MLFVRNIALFISLIISLFLSLAYGQEDFKDGDIIFQIFPSRQSDAIQIATGEKYTHVGIVFKEADGYYVYEAVQPVKITPLNEWINRTHNRHYAVKRLKNANDILTDKTIKKMKKVGKSYMGKDYDSLFQWSDQRIYCSELVWKIYKKAAHIELGQLKPFSDYDLSSPHVQALIKERYGNQFSAKEKVVSPGEIYASDLLISIDARP